MQGVPASEQNHECLNQQARTDLTVLSQKVGRSRFRRRGAEYPSGELHEAITNDAIQKARAEALGLSYLKYFIDEEFVLLI